MRTNKLITFILLAAVVCAQYACKKNSSEAPVITGIRASTPAPNDTALTKAGPGQVVIIQGANLASAKQIFFNGYPAPFNPALFANNAIIVAIPADMPFAKLNPDDLNKVKVITPDGEAEFSFPIVPFAATITAMSNENALPGDRVTIYGSNFFFVKKVIFPDGKEVTTNLTANDAGNQLQVTVPAGVTTGGPITIETSYGTATSVLLFNELTQGVLHNSDNASNFVWGCNVVTDASLFPGGHGAYNQMTFSNVNGNDWGWWNSGRSLHTSSVQWIPAANLNDPVANYALKFEISLKTSWSAGKLFIVKDGSWNYVALYSPWLNADGTTAAFTTNGWQTVTIPLTSFKGKDGSGNDGMGTSAASLKALTGNSGAGAIDIMFINNSATAISKFDMAIDNIRIVKTQ
ncbi:hypothetical protein FAM09_10140 [Niastella caeni]|uniref:Surface glycan-binding protein B xyloglucan binding domain-containing protein n=1 Tax=Niastella caeni TaxID=2569763 RepID=A0A4S8I2R3_9BACT|nr:glycan-binding surface protein [Niastella caeni]THU40222.1 hypothetical protein FAM09_10140 [Niastella caeni]